MLARGASCAGENCNNRPNGPDTTVDVSRLTPDRQFEASLFCGSVPAGRYTHQPQRVMPRISWLDKTGDSGRGHRER